MFLFIFESIGTSELILIAIVGLIFLGPRKLPQIARQIGKFMADFRSTTDDFRQTWEREVNFEEEAKVVRESFVLEDGAPKNKSTASVEIESPAIKEVEPSVFEDLSTIREPADAETEQTPKNDRRNWV